MTDYLHHLPGIAAHLGIKPDAVRHLHKAHGLPIRRLGRSVFASRSEIDAWLASRGTAPTPTRAVAAE